MNGAGAQDRHGEGADHGAENAAGAAIEAGATDHDGGDDVKFSADGGAGIALAQTGELHDASEAEKEASNGVDAGFDEAGADAAEAGGGFVGADGKNIATENGAIHENGHEDREIDGESDAGGKVPTYRVFGVWIGHEEFDRVKRFVGRIHGLVVGAKFGEAAGDAEHTESDDKGSHAKAGDNAAIEEADNGPAENGGQESDFDRVPLSDEPGGDHAGEGDDGADAEINAAADDDHGHAESADSHDDGLIQDGFEVVEAEKILTDFGRHDGGKKAGDEGEDQKWPENIENGGEREPPL